jgi:hypothetical protein
MSFCNLNISEEFNSFIWVNQKTATSLASKILENFGFKFYDVNGNKPIKINNEFVQQHSCCLFNGHETYKFIATIRNPYSQLVSEHLFFNLYDKDEQTYIDEFENFLNKKFQITNNSCFSFKERVPDYILRVENLYEDYMKIPFIKDSEFSKSGTLKKLIDSNINKGRQVIDWKRFYNKNLADLVYYNTSRYFELFNYNKNSYI